MRAEYYIRFTEELSNPFRDKPGQVIIENVEIRWDISVNGGLVGIRLFVRGLPIKYDENGYILSSYPEMELLVYRAGSYIKNQIYIHTGLDAFEDYMLLIWPEIFPESQEEETEFKNNDVRVDGLVNVTTRIRRVLDPKQLVKGFRHSAAYAYCADAIRVSSPFMKFEQFYKVIEHFFKLEGRELDKAVSTYVSRLDSKYVQSKIKKIRRLRNRCIHPNADFGHVNPENIRDVRLISVELPDLERLAFLLLRNPPF